MEDEDCTLLRYLIAKDKPNYEFLDDDEEIHTLLSAMDAENSFHCSIHKRRLVPRDRADGEARIIRQYFAANPVYSPEKFRERYRTWHVKLLSFLSICAACLHFLSCRFRMKRHVFLRIFDAVQSVDSYFQQRDDCTGLAGLSALQKVVAAMRILAYGVPLDAVDEYVQIGTSTAREALQHFCSAVIAAFEKEWIGRASWTHTQMKL
ncbi:unnamed protein product, partial [Urochloa humidicola]